MTKISATIGYIVEDTNGNAIWGIGATADEAWANVVRDNKGPFTDRNGEEISDEEARETQFKIRRATAALLAEVHERGGAISWGSLPDGTACTYSEMVGDEDEDDSEE